MPEKEISYAPKDTLQEMTTRTMAVGFALDSRLGIKPRLEHGEHVYGPSRQERKILYCLGN